MNVSETATAVESLPVQELPPLGSLLRDGKFVGLTTKPDGTHCAVVLLDATPGAAHLKWKAAMQWAHAVGAELPTRPVSAMLFANARGSFEPEWYWTSEELDGSYAWHQYFLLGLQSGSRKSYAGRARAVRLIPLAL
jgi:hypothetical protein